MEGDRARARENRIPGSRERENRLLLLTNVSSGPRNVHLQQVIRPNEHMSLQELILGSEERTAHALRVLQRHALERRFDASGHEY